jgi:nucleoside-diphosphate-sugar epimerase
MKPLIVITGRSGRIGSRAAERFSPHYTILGFDVVPPKKKYPNEFFFKVDLSSQESIDAAFQTIGEKHGTTITSVIHLAAYYSFTGEHPEKYDLITVGGTEKILKGLKGFTVEQFIFSSTMLIYAPCKVGEKIKEDSPIDAKWDYPISKVKTEKLLRERHGEIPLVLLRIAGVYDDGCHSIPISNQIQRIYDKQLESRVFPGNLTHGAAFVHMEDLIDALALAIHRREQLPHVAALLIGEDKTFSYDQLQRKISFLLFGKEMKTFRIPKIVAKIGAWVQNKLPFLPKTFIKPWMIDLADDNYELDITRAKKLLGWSPKYYLDTTLPQMIHDLKLDPIAWYKENNLK